MIRTLYHEMVYFSPDGVAEDSPWQPLSKLVGALCALFESDNVLVDKREMSFLYQMLTKPSDWFASCTEHNNSIQLLTIHGLVSATTTGLSMHNQIELSIPSRLSKSFGLSAVYVYVEQTNSNAQPKVSHFFASAFDSKSFAIQTPITLA